MTVRVERSFELDASPERVWEFIADPDRRARAISVVSSYSTDDDGRRATWEIDVPIPLVRRTVTVETEDLTRREPEYVKFRGTGPAMNVEGVHEITETADGARLENHFVVDSHLPGVERYFKKNLDDELENLRRALVRDIRANP